MTTDDPPRPPRPRAPKKRSETRAERLAAALRENLKRRKEQARSRGGPACVHSEKPSKDSG